MTLRLFHNTIFFEKLTDLDVNLIEVFTKNSLYLVVIFLTQRQYFHLIECFLLVDDITNVWIKN